MDGGCKEEPGGAGGVSGTRTSESERQKRVEKVCECVMTETRRDWACLPSVLGYTKRGGKGGAWAI